MVAAGKNSGWLQEGVVRGSMLGKTMLPTDEELGKKDDDHHFKPARRPHGPLAWTPRWRRKRVLLAVLGFCLVSVVMHYWSASPDGSHADKKSLPKFKLPHARPAWEASAAEAAHAGDVREPRGPPPGIRAPRRGEQAPHAFDGLYKFYRLAKSLRGAAHTDGYRTENRNVLFAVSSLQSAATLLPLICDMAKWNRNWVHAAFLGREDIPLQDILDINGVDAKACPAIWHDARPDYSEYSTDDRAELSVQSALAHMQNFLHPQVAIMDDARSEDAFFVAGMRNKTEVLGIPLLQVPKDKWEKLVYMTRLDAGSLRSWQYLTIDILIQVPPDSSSVLRLLKSIEQADYSGLAFPRITLELPADLDPTVERSLQVFQWPPGAAQNTRASQLVLRRRIANHRATQEDAAIRFLELFYPSNINVSHVLLLSPQAQLSPQYFHYLQYLLLEYRYSSFAAADTEKLMGLSLELPALLVDGKTPLVPPTVNDMHSARYKKLFASSTAVPFLMQAPNSHASLFFGDKWAELHSFLSNRVSKHQQSGSSGVAARAKVVSETLPAWTEYMLEFMRARGYSLIYPAASATALVTVHNELYHAPEEFSPPSLSPGSDESPSPSPSPDPSLLTAPFLRAASPPPPPQNPEPPLPPPSQPLHRLLPLDADLPETQHMPQLLYNGAKLDPSSVGAVAGKYARLFREEVGGCEVRRGRKRVLVRGRAGDLFCYGDEGEEGWEVDLEAVEGVGTTATATATATTTMTTTTTGVGGSETGV